MHEADQHPRGDQPGLGRDDGVEERDVRRVGVRRGRVVPVDGVVGQPAEHGEVARLRPEGPGVLEAPDAQVAGGDPGQHGAGLRDLALDGATGGDDGQRAGRRDAEGVHGLAHDVLAQHRADRRQPVAPARERRAPRALEVQVARPAGAVGQLAQQQRPPVAEARGVAAELVAGVALRDGVGVVRQRGAGEQPQAGRGAQRLGVQAQVGRDVVGEHQQPRVRDILGPPRHGQLGELVGEPVPQGHAERRQGSHRTSSTAAPR